MRTIKVVDLFCGCGGMSLGFQNAGFDLVAAYDNWEPAVKIYKKNFNHAVHNKDLNDETVDVEISAFKPDIIIGGPPCQDFSIAGKRNMGERSNLTIRFAEIVSSVQPEWFVMENVYNIERMPVLPKAVSILRNAGYGLTIKILDASRCGVPQARKRFFMIGHLGDTDGFLEELLNSRMSAKQMTLYEYLGDSLGTQFYYMHPRSYNRRAVFSIHEPSATIRGVNRPIPEGYQKHPADKTEILDGVRSLTSKERSYIQTFPEWFEFDGSKTVIEQAIGNAVPVKLAEYVGKCVLDYAERG
ncbi:DNA (cytosine-5)-methyltransferase 1 [Anaerovirgula multivorans]|uniref:Cytosine-specific methyltransferase n=1 Tax=Anaerovirgula multivorans TaxID=312168 RepID=A0A239I1D1_9FIRM|nr:DNA cytosine methyltransferase [Anaerovirgula multivorans]SNS87291.1 DNA (cytosine-5)-methyltransferase 1 [Anaerovirgula multivorans]